MSWSNTNKQTPKLPIRRRIQSPRSTRLYQKKSFNKSSESAKQIQESTKSSNIYQKYTDSYYILIYSQYTTIFVG